MHSSLFWTSLAFGSLARSQTFVPEPQGLSEVVSDKFPGARVSYKEVNGLCETSDNVKSYSGYVRLPKDFIPDAGSWPEDAVGNLFFWYFEARNNPESAPTAIYLGGGPGYTSFDDSAVFPCFFNEDSNSTTLNEHSWNTDTNMLYIDQPVGTGFSYSNLTNGTYDLLRDEFEPVESEDDLPDLSLTLRQATLDRSQQTLTNTSMAAARTLWRFSQVFFNDFPEWQTENDAIAVWAVSYGGLYGPMLASYAVDQNALIEDGSHELSNATTLNIQTVGVMNAVVDVEAMALGFADFSRNNTYGIEVFTEELALKAVESIVQPGGCQDLSQQCRAAVAEDDEDSFGAVDSVNDICKNATEACLPISRTLIRENTTISEFDITLNRNASNPVEYNTAFFNQPWVQAELGVPLNYTRANNDIQNAFLLETGDMARYNTSYLSNLLANGVNIAMLYGDFDYRCNWFSGENASLQIDFADKDAFADAGYAPLRTNSSYQGGFVREAGNLSFSRVFGAGHSAGGYQPETVAAIFNRSMFGFDVATGEVQLSSEDSYTTEGNQTVRDEKQDPPEPLENICYVFFPHDRCTLEQLEALADGSAETKDWVVTNPKSTKDEAADLEDADDDDDDDDSGGDDNGGDSGSDSGNDGGSDDSGNGDDGDGDDDEDAASKTGLTATFAIVAITALIAAW